MRSTFMGLPVILRMQNDLPHDLIRNGKSRYEIAGISAAKIKPGVRVLSAQKKVLEPRGFRTFSLFFIEMGRWKICAGARGESRRAIVRYSGSEIYTPSCTENCIHVKVVI